MSWRTILISSQSKLDYKMGYLVIRGSETHRVFIDEIATLVIENPAVSLTGCLIEILIEKKVKVIFCDSKRNPTAELIPHHGCHDSSFKIRLQIGWPDWIKEMVWQEIVIQKIRKQADFLKFLKKNRESELLLSYCDQVELYDASNREGHAAKVYFNALFGMDFTRTMSCPINAALNYGYSMLLSTFNREIAANGYLTQIGIFHNNVYNHFNLGCDLMEPFRVVVDRFVFEHFLDSVEFEKDEKHLLWTLPEQLVVINGSVQSLPNAIKIFTKSVFDAINDQDISKIKNYQFK